MSRESRDKLDEVLGRMKHDLREVERLVEEERESNPQPVLSTHDRKPNLRPHTILGWWQVWSGGLCVALLDPEDVAPVRKSKV